MSKSTKDKRDAHFKKGAAKDDEMTIALTNQRLRCKSKTKPSKYTNKVKKMFPDLYKENKRIPREKDNTEIVQVTLIYTQMKIQKEQSKG